MNEELAYTIDKVAEDYLKIKRRNLYWKIASRSIMIVLLITIFYMTYNNQYINNDTKSESHIAIIDIKDSINQNAHNIIKSINSAFKNKKAESIILQINVGGGTAVKSNYIFNEIMRLRSLYPDKKIISVCTNVCASAGYFIASAAEEVYADPASMVGSIGVLYNGLGYSDLMKYVGIDRRLITSGNYKNFMDPLSPANIDHEEKMHEMLTSSHEHFIKQVKMARKGKLADDGNLFSGLIWSGDKLIELGLIDGFGNRYSVARDILEQESIINYTPKPNIIEQLQKNLQILISSLINSEINNKSLILG